MRFLLLLSLLSFGLFGQSADTLRAVSPDYFLSTGNEAFSTGRVGEAIVAYERGLRLQPGHDALTNNLAYVRQEAELESLELPLGVVPRIWRGAGALLGATTAFVLAILLWWIAVAGIAYWGLRRNTLSESRRFVLLPVSVLLLVLALSFYLLGSSRNDFLNQEDQAVLTTNADLRVAPGPDATLERQLKEGVKFRIVDDFENYVKVSLPDGRQGWLPTKNIAII